MRITISLIITVCFLVLTARISDDKNTKRITKNIFQKRADLLRKGFFNIPLPGNKKIRFNLTKDAQADESECDSVLDAVDEGIPSYTAGSLSYFNSTLYYLNNRNAADVENVFCHFTNTMNMDGSAGTETIEYDDGSGSTMYVKVVITDGSTTGGFEEDAGYTKKAVVSVSEDNSSFTTYMVMYWGFAEGSTDTTTTKGFLIEGSPKTLGGTRAGYMRWDLTGTTQTGQFYAAEFPSAEDESDPTNITPANYFMKSETNSYENDRFMYGRFSLNTSTNEVHVQGLSIEAERKQGNTPENYGCFKIYGTGKKGGMMVISKTRDQHSSDAGEYGFAQRGHLTDDGESSAATSLIGMDAACLRDLTTTANLKGNLNGPGVDVDTWRENIEKAINAGSLNTIDSETDQIFDISCDDLVSANGSGNPFDESNGSSWVDFTASPGDVFGASNANDVTAPTEASLCAGLNSEDIDTTTKCYCAAAAE